ncbi:TlpA family protein disulfide reductase [Chryseobacterium gregarium]|uniref:TlpA family protein disulfide reductase n=1 Tax=Chryseobacterium gregarium TaxID=456299 RepID=UPI0009D6A3BA|nr:TlpA disulfide reductase family protein [Chryseobacterium gregarium]
MKKFVILFLLVCNSILIAQTSQFRTFPDMEKKLGTHFPIENYKDKDGKNFDSNYLKGKNTLINLWFTNCAPCIKEIPVLNELKESVPNANFIAITHDPADKVNNFLLKRSYTFFQITDAGKQLQSYLMVQRFPMSFILDKEGNIREIMGLVSEDKLPMIKKILRE